MSKCIVENEVLIFTCPHCSMYINVHISELACCIFRHGYYVEISDNKINLKEQINPHSSEVECNRLKNNSNVLGCCMPFKIVKCNSDFYVEICDFI
jgi:hypothetical protein